MLHSGGLQKGTVKKTAYLNCLSSLIPQKRIIWHATDEQELKDIKIWFGDASTVYLAYDTPRPLPNIEGNITKQTNELRLVYYSLITSKKNLHLALQALVKVTFPVVFDVYGPIIESGYWDDCLGIIETLPSNITVTHKGNVLFSHFAAAAPNYHFLILPSKGENFGHVIYEALSLGLPVIISHNTPWKFDDGYVGYYVDLTDDSINNTIKKVYELDTEAYELLSKNARYYAETFYKISISTCQQQYGAIFNLPVKKSVSVKPILLILYDYFLPGFKAGGPIQSIGNMVSLLQENYDCRVITQGFDLNSNKPYDNINLNEWNNLYLENSSTSISVFYTKKGGTDFLTLERLFKKIKPDVVYVNGVYTFRFALQPLLLSYFSIGKLPYKIVVCPRGMLQEGALSSKAFKKRTYLFLLRVSGVLKHITWHATNKGELSDIGRFLGPDFKSQIAHNIPRNPVTEVTSSNKKVGELRLIYLSLITEKKNLDLLIQILIKCKGNISLDIYGPIKDAAFWAKCRSLIQLAPSNISIIYKSLVLPSNIQQTLINYNALVLLTKGENFGHALVESLGVARPIITSINTPWHFLEEKKGGWIMPIENINECVAKMDSICNINEHHFMEYNKRALQMVKEYFAENDFKTEYMRLFNVQQD